MDMRPDDGNDETYRHVAETNTQRVVELPQHGGFLRLMAQELGRVAGAYASSPALGQDRDIGDRIAMLNLMANVLSPEKQIRLARA